MVQIPENLMKLKTGNRIYVNDSTRKIIEQNRDAGETIQPWVLLRWATDACYVQDSKERLPAYGSKAHTRSLHNTVTPCQVVPNILSWQVSENLDSEVTTASFEAVNALQVSEIETTLSAPLNGDKHNYHIWANYVTNSKFVLETIKGDRLKFKITSPNTGDPFTNHREFNIDMLSQSGGLANNEIVEFDGEGKNDSRRTWQFSNSNTMADPGTGKFRFNANKTKIAVSKTDYNGKGSDWWLTHVLDEKVTLRTDEGDIRVADRSDKYGVKFKEDNLKFRQFEMQRASLTSTTGFPNPSIPTYDADNDCPDDDFFPKHPRGVGAYYILIDDEIIKVCGKDDNDYLIPPGGRGLGGTKIAYHAAGAPVKLLGFEPFTGEAVGYGIFTVDEDKPQESPMRTGNCLTSYEGYNNTEIDLIIPYVTGTTNAEIVSWLAEDSSFVEKGDQLAHILIAGTIDYYLLAPEDGLLFHILEDSDAFSSNDSIGILRPSMKHNFREDRSFQFTGYWFIKSCEDSFGEDGVPRVKVELEGPGALLANQQINMNTLMRTKNRFGQWQVDGEDLFAAANHDRSIPGDWVDYATWDPSVKGSYPLQLKTKYAQHKEFLEHIQSTELGKQCNQCRDELAKWKKQHPGKNTYSANKKIGRHIYKQSVRVMENEAGPIKTYIRLMLTMAMAAWDHPPQGVELAQRFTKIPNKLFDNMRDIRSGLIYNGQLDFELSPSLEHKYWAWDKPSFDDEQIISKRKELSCPFESTYDKTPFSQPAKDLAEVNGAVFTVNRRGFPIFMPRNFRLRPQSRNGTIDDRLPGKREIPGEWYLALGGSVTTYSKSIDTSSILTQAQVTAKTAFDSTFTVTTAGTGTKKQSGSKRKQGLVRVMYGALSGHKEGLAMTGGVQQQDTVSMESIVLGLEWNANPHQWGLNVVVDGDNRKIEKKPRLYDGSPPLSEDTGKKHKFRTLTVQKTINWFLERRYINPIQDPKDDKKYWYLIEEDGVYGPVTATANAAMEAYLKNRLDGSGSGNGTYDRTTHRLLVRYFNKYKEWIQDDIWWYAYNGRTWQEYVAHVTGIPVSAHEAKNFKSISSKQAVTTPKWIIDDKGMQKEVEKWQKQYIQSAMNVGNRKIDDSFVSAIKRTINVNFADPRIQLGDVIFTDASGEATPSGTYVNSITRSMDLTGGGAYTGSYSGYKHKVVGGGVNKAINKGFDFLK